MLSINTNFLNFNNNYPRDAKDESDFSKKCKVKDKETISFIGRVMALAISNKTYSCLWPNEENNCYGITQTIKRIEKTTKLKVIGIKRL